jgi:signal peptidase I
MNRTTRSLIFLLASSGVLLLMTKLFFLDMIVVRGPSMEPTLKEGTPILINKLAFGLVDPGGAWLARWGSPGRGEIVVFKSPEDGTTAVKRCLAVAGDILRVRDHELVFGAARLPLKFYQEGIVGPQLQVPPGCVFLVGDNAALSADSRTYGSVPVERVTAAMIFSPAPPPASPSPAHAPAVGSAPEVAP